MSVGSGVPYNAHTGNGLSTVFAYGFTLLDAADLVVTIDGSVTSAYTVAGLGVAVGGSITFSAAPANGAAVLLERVIQLVRSAEYQTNGDLQAITVNGDLDRLWLAVQQVDAETSRALRVPEVGGASPLPPAAERANLLLSFDDDGNPTVVAPASGSAAELAITLAARRPLHALDYGATGSGDETVQLKALFDAAIPASRAVVLRGAYTVSGPITSSTYASGSLHIICDGPVTITVDASAATFNRLIACETTAANNICIEGGALSIVGNNRVGTAIHCRHYGLGGTVRIGTVKATNCKQSGASAIENAGVYILGRYTLGEIHLIEVNGVDRADSATASRGVLIQDINGPFVAHTLKISNVLATGFSADADGLYFSGYTAGGANTQRAGSLTVGRAEIADCQGRSIKAQHQDVTIRDCIIRRQLVSTFATVDVDFQLGGGQIDNLLMDYFKSGATNPLEASFYPVASQHTCADRATVCRIGKWVLRSEVQVPRLVQIIVAATAMDGATFVSDVDLVPYNGFTGSFFARCAVEFDAGQVAASSNKTHISVRGVRGDMAAVPILGHTTFGASVAGKLSVEAIGNENTGTGSAGNKTIGATSGFEIPALLAFNFRDNAGFHALMMATFAFNTQTLADGCRFTYVRATATVTNGPVIAAGTYVDVECLGSINGTSRKVRMTVDNAGTMDEHYTQSGAWGVIK